MARINNIRWIFSDYEDGQIGVLPWAEYSFHLSESSLRGVSQAEEKLRAVLGGGAIGGQAWRDLRSVYGLATGNNTISQLGNDFIAFCNTATNDFSKEFWLYYHLLYSDDILRSQQIRRINSIYSLLNYVPSNLQNSLLNGTSTGDRILAFVEHILRFPLAIQKFFSLPWDDLVELVTFTDNQMDALIASLTVNENNLKRLLSRMKTFNRYHLRRRIAIESAMLIPIIERIDFASSTPLRIYAPFNRFFSRTQVREILSTRFNYEIHDLN